MGGRTFALGGGDRTFSVSYVFGEEELFRPQGNGGRTFSASVYVLSEEELFRPLCTYLVRKNFFDLDVRTW